MQREATLEYDEPLIREAVAGFWRRSVGIGTFVALALMAAAETSLVLQGDRSWVVGLCGAVLLFGAAFVAAIYIVHYRSAVQRLHRMGSPRASFRANEDSFTVTSGAGTSTLPWSSVTEVWKLKNCWLLLFSRAQFVTLPLACLPQELKAFVLERVAAAGGKTDG